MDFRLIVSVVALIVSLISIYISVKSNRFNQRVKGVELRSNVLMKFAEISVAISSAKEYLIQIKIEAEEINDLKLYKIVSHIDTFERISNKVDRLHEEAKKLDISKGISMYENIFHELHSIKIEAEKELSNTKSRVEAYKSKA